MVGTNILNHVKSYVNQAFIEDDAFDNTLMIPVTSYISIASQLVDLNNIPVKSNTTYEELMKYDSPMLLELLKHYVVLRVRLDFDPPVGSVLTSLEKSKGEIEERLIIEGRLAKVDHERRLDSALQPETE